MTGAALKVIFVAFSLGLDVFAVCIGIGMRGTSTRAKFRIGVAFATAEVTMTLLGVGVGTLAGRLFGDVAAYVGFAALAAVGSYMVVESVRGDDELGGIDLSRGWGLMLGALSLSLDSLGIGFSVLFIGVPLPVSLVAIAGASVTSTTCGLALGRRLGARLGEVAALWAGIILVATGVAFAALKFFSIG